MRILTEPTTVTTILADLATAGPLVRRSAEADPAAPGWTFRLGPGLHEWTGGDGNRYRGGDVSGMLPLYREIYRRIFAEWLTAWGMAGDEISLLYGDGLILYWGPEAFMRERQPKAVALKRLMSADDGWVAWLEGWWQQAASEFEDRANRFWAELCQDRADGHALRALVGCKVSLNAIGVDSLMPSRALVEEWLAPLVPPALLADVVDGCFLPADGGLAYDALEMERWRLAAAFQAEGFVTETARARFIREALFFLYDALNTERKAYYFDRYPLETAITYSQAAPGAGEVADRMREVRDRDWRRRMHHEWARQQLDAIQGATDARRRLLVLHHLLGTARDFDEAKRRLNRKLWQSLFAVADGLGVSLADPRVDVDELCAAVERAGGRVTIDPTFGRAETTPDEGTR